LKINTPSIRKGVVGFTKMETSKYVLLGRKRLE
jgi:hypothetical protein